MSDVNNVKKIVYDYLQEPKHKEELRKLFFEIEKNDLSSTKISSGGLVGEAGSQGFGVCECPDIDKIKSKK